MNYKPAKLYDANNELNQQWFVFYYFRNPENGKFTRFRIWISQKIITRSGRRDKAHEVIKLTNSRLQQGWSPYAEYDRKLHTIAETFDFAYKVKSATIGKRSRQTYQSVYNKFLGFLEKNKLKNIAIGDLNYKIVQDFFDNSMITEKITSRTYNNRISALKTIFNFMVKRDYILFNPVNRVERLPESDPELTAYTKRELEMISKKLPEWNYNLYVISQLVFYCFLRPAEIVRLQFRDIQWDRSMIMVPGGKSKNRRSEMIIMPDQLLANLKDWNLDHPPDWYLFSTNLIPGNKEIAPTRIAEAWRKFADTYNIRKGIYDLKHTGNGMAFDLGINARDIQLQNRHHSLEQTQQYLNKFRRIPGEKFKKDFKGF